MQVGTVRVQEKKGLKTSVADFLVSDVPQGAQRMVASDSIRYIEAADFAAGFRAWWIQAA